MTPFSFAIGFLGCRANEVEADALRGALLAVGGHEAAPGESPDLTVLNTCAVTAAAVAQSRNGVRRARRSAPAGLLLVTGCGAQLDPAAFADLPGVDLVVGNRHKADVRAVLHGLARAGALRLPPGPAREEALARALAEAGLAPLGAAGGREQRGAPVCWTADPTLARLSGRIETAAGRRTRPSIKIQDGCSFRCTYCIVAALRGRPVSRDPADVLAEARRLVAVGAREVVLAGINLGLYGREAGPPAEGGEAGAPAETGAPGAEARAGEPGALGRLLADLGSVPGLERIRLSSLEPMTITTELLDRIAALPKVARSLHVPFQSGDDGVLRSMGRPYGASELEALAERITARLPLCGLGVDIVAGFPGESPAAFGRTLALLERLAVTYLHAFAYSERPGTPAATLTPRVPVAERRARVARLRELDARLRVRFQRRLVGRACRLVVERVQGDRFTGMSGEYVRMSGEARGLAPGDWVTVVAGETLEPGRQECRLAERPAARPAARAREGA